MSHPAPGALGGQFAVEFMLDAIVDMRLWKPIILALLFAGCSQPSSPPAPVQPQGAAAEPSPRALDSFAFDWATTTVQDVVAKVGAPDRDVGSGIHVLAYRLRDGSNLWLGSPDNSTIIYVRHGRGAIGDSEIFYERRAEVRYDRR